MRRRIPFAAALILFASCASAPPFPLRIDISGQVIDRQFRELVVHATNTGTSTLRDVRLMVTLPESLPVIGRDHTESMTLENIETAGAQRVYRYAIAALPPAGTAAAHFPFRTSSMGTIEAKTMTVTARMGSAVVETKRMF